MTLAGPVVVGFVIALVLTPLVRYLSHRHQLLDRPNERSSHVRPTPRAGGIAIVVGMTVAFLAFGRWDDSGLNGLLACAGAIALLGLLDDVVSLRAPLKLVVHVGAAAAALTLTGLTLRVLEVPLAGHVRLTFWSGVALSLLWIVGVTNAYNFMDGVNGIASIEAIVCAVAYAVMFRSQGDSVAAVLCLGLAGGAAGFLVYNANGSIFMGDVGSAMLGFLFAVLGLRLADQGVPFLAALLPLLPFLVDTSLTLLRRVRRRERLFSAHRTHAYQRLTDLGWSHLRVSWTYGLIASACAALAIFRKNFAPDAFAAAILLLTAGLVLGSILIERSARGRQA